MRFSCFVLKQLKSPLSNMKLPRNKMSQLEWSGELGPKKLTPSPNISEEVLK